MKKIIFIILILALGGAILYQYRESRITNHESLGVAERYQCPMHPQIIQDHPGNCPICGMRLVKIEKDRPDAQAVLNEAVKTDAESKNKPGKVAFYRNPMDPAVTSPVPAKDSMGMDYIPVNEEMGEKTPASDVTGHAAVRLTVDKIQMIGITTAEAKKETLMLPLLVTGTVFHNHEIFELLSAYRDAIQVEQRVKKPTPELIAQSRTQAWSLRSRLRRYGIGDDVFEKAEKSLADPSSFIPAHLIIDANGAYIDARLAAGDAVHLKIGQRAWLTSAAFEGRKIEGIVKSVDSLVDTATQTVGVRIEAKEAHELLQPGLFVDVAMSMDLGTRFVIPDTAVFNPGKSAYVFVEKEPGLFVPRYIETGISAGEKTEVLSGLKEGEKVVTAANFLLDSESRFRAVQQHSTSESATQSLSISVLSTQPAVQGGAS